MRFGYVFSFKFSLYFFISIIEQFGNANDKMLAIKIYKADIISLQQTCETAC